MAGASVYNYQFYNMSNLENDVCYLTERSKQNTGFANYNVTNYFTKNCGLGSPLEVATNQPAMMVNGGFGNTGVNGCNVNVDSNMRLGGVQTNPKARISLYTRPFVSIPNLARGESKPEVESRLQQGEGVKEKKSISTTTEKSHLEYRHTPMLAHLRQQITNPNNLVEESAAKGWIRGGLPSRELIRDANNMRR
jgi:hypothetical protein